LTRLPGLCAAAAALLACSSACRAGEAEQDQGTLFVEASARAGDGSRARPFNTLAAAVAAARDGERIVVAAGVYRERLRLERPIRIEGLAGATLVAPEPEAVAIEALAAATIEGLRIVGGAIGVRGAAPLTLRSVSFEGQRRAAVSIEKGSAELIDLRLSAGEGPRERVGIAAAPGTSARVVGLRSRGSYRFAVRAEGAQLDADEAQIEGAVVGIACTQGCEGSVRDSFVTHVAGAGILAGNSAHLVARDNLVSGCEQCFVANRDARLILEDNVTFDCALSSIASVSAHLEAKHHLHSGPTRLGAIQLLGGETLLDEGAILDPGGVGVSVRGGRTVIRGTLVRGARLDRDGDFGNAVFALSPESVRLEGALLEQSQGAALTAQGGPVEAFALEAQHGGLFGVEAQRGSSVALVGAHVHADRGPALIAIEGSRIRSTLGRYQGNTSGVGFASCDESSELLLDTPPANAPSCIRPLEDRP
jgi:hypothetical protein